MNGGHPELEGREPSERHGIRGWRVGCRVSSEPVGRKGTVRPSPAVQERVEAL